MRFADTQSVGFRLHARIEGQLHAAADRYLASPVVRAQTDSVAALALVLGLDLALGFPMALRLGYVFPVCLAARGAGPRWSLGVVAATSLILTTVEFYATQGQIHAIASLVLNAGLLGLLHLVVRRLETGLARYQLLAWQDPLTGLPNRAALERLGAKAVERASARSEPLAAAIIDCDRFKDLNDTYGHAYGDMVLKLLARALNHTVGRDGWVARTGGDEFAVLLPGNAALGADALLEEARVLFAERIADGAGFTFGSALWRPGTDLDALLAAADRAMYANKRQRAPRRAAGTLA